MPYRREGSDVYHLKHGRWVLKEHTRSPGKARAAVHLLYGLESGWRPSRRR
jgi:hypothetical protein